MAGADEIKDEKKTIFVKVWGFFRWPILAGFLLVSLTIFFVGLVFNFGYSGTTSLRAMNITDDSTNGDKFYWDAFYPILFEGKKGSPYIDLGNEIHGRYTAARFAKNILNFDKRLVRELIYLAQGSNKIDKKCGWSSLPNSQHDRIVLQTAGESLSHPSSNLPSSSPLNRGVGVRINEADYIKCSYKQPPKEPSPSPRSICDNQWYVYGRYMLKLNSVGGGYQLDATFQPQPSVNPICIEQVKCAVDFFPNPGPNPILNAPPNEILTLSDDKPSKHDSDILKNGTTALNPEVFDVTPPALQPSSLIMPPDKVRQAAVYKIAQLALQLLATDDQGCENTAVTSLRPSDSCKGSTDGNVGNCRNIPYTIILPDWAAKEIHKVRNGTGGTVWIDFENLARGKYPDPTSSEVDGNYKGLPYNLQDESPTAGITGDERLDELEQGLHFNY